MVPDARPGRTNILNKRTKSSRTIVHSGFRPSGASLAPDGRTLASRGVIDPPRSCAGRAAWHARSDLAAGHWRVNRAVVLIDPATGRRLARAAGESDVLFSPDGRREATTGFGGQLSIRVVPPAGR